MRIYVEPAKRPGRKKLISKQSLNAGDIERDGDCLVLTFEADGIYDASRYRYTIELCPECVAALKDALERPIG
ncbi:hypothetical protein [Aquamicrobium sp. LC103]|uniref:hypothetical protein n=1 Tax=Aquamicrobium sp. LC103 TaxID=1120658 RepID=UPI00063EC15D|nr:hypothetical protein [Aquamicrobium sp. LC103]TKT78442.1 hypothetical protein XW59_012570 [Aquamicrobium sp. LC103]TKT79956.1 hypothetical protein XW59_006225 [Aquamicrobium sp. LC103]